MIAVEVVPLFVSFEKRVYISGHVVIVKSNIDSLKADSQRF